MSKTKAEIRKEYGSNRKSVSVKDRVEMDEAITQSFLRSFAFGTIRTLHTFLPIPERNEINTYELIDGLLNDVPGLRIVVSRMDMRSKALSHYFWKPGDPLIKNKWGIPEPDPEISVEATIEDIDLVVIPLMAFDRHGYRVGYGAGFYDRFLAECRPGILKVGLSYFPPMEDDIEAEEHDMVLDFCITPEEVIKF